MSGQDADGGRGSVRYLPLPPDELRRRILAAGRAHGRPMRNLVESLLLLHAGEMERLSLGHEDCEECDDWTHQRLVCRDCRGTDEEQWTFVLWPCPTVQHMAHALRCYPDQEAPTTPDRRAEERASVAENCAWCDGTGEIVAMFRHGMQVQDCTECEGTGRAS